MAINFVDTVFNTSATGNVIKYNLQHADSTTEQVQLSVATPITTQGTALNKVFFDAVNRYLVPVGVICLWSGSASNIPTGWVLCNGSNGTPDLRDRFIVGAGNSYNVGATGGEASHTLTVNELPAHNHGFRYRASAGANHSALGLNTGSASSDYVTPHTTKTVTNNDLVVDAGGGQAHENRPPYYALCYIMKINN